MLSRVAESIYWMSRYIERAENVARFVDVNLRLILDAPVGIQAQWEPLVATTGDDEVFAERYGEASREAVIRFLAFDTENPNSIVSCLRAGRENARSIRENISSEMWEQLNDAYLLVANTSEEWAMAEPHEFFTEIKLASHLFMGLTDNIMSHSEGWHFCQLGRLIERADKTSRIVDVKYFILLPSIWDVDTPFDDIQWGALLHSASGFEMYRRTYGLISPDDVVAFLLLDREFPRSVLYCLSKAEESLHAISGTPLETFSNSAEQRLGQLRAEFAYAQVKQILSSGLHEFLDAFQTKLNLVGEDIHKTFLRCGLSMENLFRNRRRIVKNMAIRVAINHKSLYQYDRLVNLSPHIFRLRPAVHCRTPIEAYSLRIEPENHFINWQQDPFGNYQARVVFQEPTRALSIEVDLVADLTVINPFDFFLETSAEHYPFLYEAQLKEELAPFLEVKESGPLLTAWLAGIPRTKKKMIDFLVDINRSLSEGVKYTIRMEPGVQSCEETLEKQIGSCRDTGWLLVQMMRHLGLAARFVSGYLVQLAADQKPVDGPAGPAQDFTDLHAWCEVYAPGAGWIGLDPTSGLFAGEGHIPLACVPDPVSAAPVTGYTDLCETEFTYSNTVQRIYEDPRVTKPYTEAQWADINALGQQVDRDIIQNDIRLTMGGEPTFVSIDDTEGPEWDTEADSPRKRELAAGLLRRLRDSFGPGGARYYGQGKWYPGELLPRWKFGCFWRKDGVPVWQNDELLADPHKDYGVSTEDAERFMRHLTQQLNITSDQIIPAYEDALYFLWTEDRLPVNINPLDFNFKAASERQRLAQLLQTDALGEPIGYALPLRWNRVNDVWESCVWRFKDGRMYLIPGDSPIGFRLPLESIQWVPPEQREIGYERDPLEPREEYLKASAQTNGQNAATHADGTPNTENGEAQSVFQTALCIEPREGRLYIFIPPLTHLEHYLSLLEAVEATAEVLKMPVILEGYEVPHDWRIQSLNVTPDPGVIEVNIHPAENWNALVHNTTTLYAQARLAGLSAEKFMLDGRHTGTGGGNHVIIGGRTPADSPLLRRPHLLRSLITYWQHHPGLSYLFSGTFIGPTSQAPRVDEGRDEQLYELEVAFARIPDDDAETGPPWLIDRLLRHLLVDLTGNTHRAEFCIDKLYSPDSASGRLGLLEMRAFEMPPHAQMSVVQMLLIRTLVAKFWKTPYQGRLVRWGTALHDRFMLHHYVRSDIAEVVSELQVAGYPFEMAWLEPFFEFRFPKLGTVNVENIEIELRMAIEPWHVLGEEVTRTGTSRFVDSSVERLQVKVNGLTDSRYVVTCNGRRLMLHNTGTHGEYVGGVRYRAWQPPSALHPTIGIHSPLVFDIIDTWNGRAIGGCTYRVSHPGGRHYGTFPVNAYEAEARRTSRFGTDGHTPGVVQSQPAGPTTGHFHAEGTTPGPIDIPPEETNAEYPWTLDLRRH